MEFRNPQFITVREFGAKANNKYEIDLLLRRDAQAYLPEMKCLTVWFYKDLISGRKQVSEYTQDIKILAT